MPESPAVAEICSCLTPGKVHNVCFNYTPQHVQREKRVQLRQLPLATSKGMSDAYCHLVIYLQNQLNMCMKRQTDFSWLSIPTYFSFVKSFGQKKKTKNLITECVFFSWSFLNSEVEIKSVNAIIQKEVIQ